MTGTVLIVDDVATNRIVMKVKMASACYDTLQAGDGTSALALARSRRPDAILLDMNLPDLSGIEVCRQLKADPVTADIPVIIVTTSRDGAARRDALRAGADDFLSKPVRETILMARLRSLLRARQNEAELRLRDGTSRAFGLAEPGAAFTTQGTIALIAAQADTALAWRRALAPHVSDRLVMLRPAAALTATGPAPEVYLIAADLAHSGDGLRLMSELRSRGPSRHAAVCIVLPPAADGARADTTAAMALDLGAADLLPADFDPEETALRLTAQLERKRRADRLRDTVRSGLRMAVTDPLTGLYNRRYALPYLARMDERARQTGRSYAVMVLDLDRFKAVNDTFGHAAGDAVLAEVARRLLDNLRPVDLVARIGGEEFLVAMPDAHLATARAAAERLCRVVEAQPVTLPCGPDGPGGSVGVTVSIGLSIGGTGPADPPPGGPGLQGDPVAGVLGRADSALLAAKAAGRNKVTVALSAA
ncbi:diguanylate cyclase [Rhodobaculum claviforme]|uniref:diguanylate cyclase n=1 Tax=Rhodobaculum claviforme TaxID=1549854 RepID=A0A934TP20_9RHOB|nr:diguanylate cyclase [Rhodobaculum claviforme]MBK5928782.1 diguanylate cyclase response regulator [Rhodobaculum claviforme]